MHQDCALVWLPFGKWEGYIVIDPRVLVKTSIDIVFSIDVNYGMIKETEAHGLLNRKRGYKK
jgi:hypothetical protein